MTYRETLKYLFDRLPMYQRIGKAAYKADLENTLALDEYFGYSHRYFKSIHIAGTNGKGSVSHILASIFQSAGWKTGLYTSPHVKDFRERIKVNGVPVPEKYVIEFTKENRKIFESIEPSFFEMTVAMAFKYFADQNVDIAIIEAGMGGRLDSTNIITPMASVITNIGTDHSEFLGTSLKSIALEKAGIIKHKIPVIIGETHPETTGVFKTRAEEYNSRIVFAQDEYSCISSPGRSGNSQFFKIKKGGKTVYRKLETDLLGSYQQKNAVTAIQTLDVLKSLNVLIPKENILKGFRKVIKNTGLLGRWQVLEKKPMTICDTAHNIEALKEVTEQLSRTQKNRLHMVIGFNEDKDVTPILEILPRDAIYYFTKAPIPRAMSVERLMKSSLEAGLNGYGFETVKDALQEARKNASPSDLIFIGGSTFVVSEIL